MRKLAIGAGAAVVLAAAVFAFTWRPALAPVASHGPFDPALVTRGAQFAAIGDCAICHAAPDGTSFAGGTALPTPFGAVAVSNITPDPATGIGTWSQAAFARAMHDGVAQDGHFLYPAFPYDHFAHVTDADIAALYAFLMTREPVKAATPATHLPFPLNIRPLMAGWNALFLDHTPVTPDPDRSAEWNRGKYLVDSLGHCAACHSPRNALGAEDTSRPFTGGTAEGWEAPGLTAASSPAAIAWSADALYRFLHHGLDDQHAASAGPMGAVSHDLSQVPAAEVRAIAVYIASMTDPAGHAAPPPAIMAKVAAAQTPPAALAQTEGAAIFAGACAGCHGAGAPMMLNGRPSLALGSSVTAATPRNAAQTVLWGLQPGPGERGPWMPPFSASLTDRQVAAVLAYLRGRFTDRPAWPDLDTTVQHIRQDRSAS